MDKKLITRFSIVAMLAGLFAVASINASTINGVANQLISGLTQYGVVVAGANDLGTIAPSSTVGYALISQGASANPTFGQVSNTGLANSSITFNSAGCITANGTISLGGSLTLSNSCTGFTGLTSTTPGASPTWTLQNGDIAWTLSANATVTVTIATADKWVPHTVQICQPSSGGPYTFTWPSNVKGGMTIGTSASKCNMQTFESYDGANLYATGTGILNQ